MQGTPPRNYLKTTHFRHNGRDNGSILWIPAFAGIADGLAEAMYEDENGVAPASTQGGRHWRREPAREFARVTYRYV